MTVAALVLSSVGVVVIVLGNYFDAAFYEASGASTCNFGFIIPVETNAPPIDGENSMGNHYIYALVKKARSILWHAAVFIFYGMVFQVRILMFFIACEYPISKAERYNIQAYAQ